MDQHHINWLTGLPYDKQLGPLLFSHGAVPAREKFRYPKVNRMEAAAFQDVYAHADDIADELERREVRALIHGHTHQPIALYPTYRKPHHVRYELPMRPDYPVPERGTAIVDAGSAGFVRPTSRARPHSIPRRPPSFVLFDPSTPGAEIRFVRFAGVDPRHSARPPREA